MSRKNLIFRYTEVVTGGSLMDGVVLEAGQRAVNQCDCFGERAQAETVKGMRGHWAPVREERQMEL